MEVTSGCPCIMHLGNNNEGANGYAKDGAFESMDDSRAAGYAVPLCKAPLVALQLFGSNLRRIDGFVRDLGQHVQQSEKTESQRPRPRLTTPISAHLPVSAIASTGPSLMGPLAGSSGLRSFSVAGFRWSPEPVSGVAGGALDTLDCSRFKSQPH